MDAALLREMQSNESCMYVACLLALSALVHRAVVVS